MSMSSSLLQQTLKAFPRPASIKIRKEADVEAKLQALATHGPSALQFITDFDATLTRYHLNGERCDSSYGIVARTDLVPEDMRREAWELFAKYHPIEVDPNLTFEEKVPFMVEWYEKSHCCMIEAQPPIHKSSIQQMVAESKAFLRDNAKELLEQLSSAAVPVLVLSAGIGDVVQEVLNHNGVNFSNVKVISNFIEFNASGHIGGFKKPLIHTFNKNEAALHDNHTSYFEDLKSRHNVILLGDSLGDVNMDNGVTNPKCVLKIGFLNHDTDLHLDSFMNSFDIVIIDDQSMDFVNTLLKTVLGQ